MDSTADQSKPTARKGKPALTFNATPNRTKAAPDTESNDRTFLAVRLPIALITRLKTAAAQDRRKLQDVAEEAMTEWLANRH
jgi:hypothetical protein